MCYGIHGFPNDFFIKEIFMKNAVVFLADGFEEIEALTIVDYLRRGGVEVFTVAVPSPAMADPYIVISSHKVPVIADMSFDEFKDAFKDETPSLSYVPGGMPGSVNCAANKDLTDFITKCFNEGKHVSAICAAPAIVLSKTGMLKGKNWTCYPGMEEKVSPEDVENSTHCDNVPFVTDGNITTGRGAGAAEELAMELVRILCGEEVANGVKVGTCQR